MLRSKSIFLSEQNYLAAFVSGSSRGAKCACGVFCFDTSSNLSHTDKAKSKEFIEKAKESPKLYLALDQSIKVVRFGGNGFVVGCSCARTEKIKEAMDFSSENIAKYLNSEVERLLNQAVALTVSEVQK